MNDKPTFKEFNGMLRDVVKTTEGRYFIVDNYVVLRRMQKAIIIGGLFIFSLIPQVLIAVGTIPYNAIFDFLLLCMLIGIPFEQLHYRLSRFKELKNDTEEFRDAEGWFSDSWSKAKRVFRLIMIIILLPILLFAFANSFTIQYIRSVIENLPEAQAEPYDKRDDMTIIPVSDDTDRVVVAKGDSTAIVVTVSGTAAIAQAFIDGQLMTKGFRRISQPSFFWQADYLINRYHIFPEEADVHDGSVLEMTCGDLHRKWVFDLTEEGAA